MRVLDLFSGIGGFSLGLERAGMRTVAFCEIEPYARAVLRKHWPDIPCAEDITKREFKEGEADVICGGFPCQDISVAGFGSGLTGARSGLWRELVRAIRVVRPLYAIVENVAALLRNGMGTVLGDLAEIGYDAEWDCIPASSIGAPHQRDRVWITAYPDSQGVERQRASIRLIKTGPWGWSGERDFQALCEAPFEPRDNRWPQPILRRMDDGLRNRMERLKCCGNSVVPAIPQIIGEAIMAANRA